MNNLISLVRNLTCICLVLEFDHLSDLDLCINNSVTTLMGILTFNSQLQKREISTTRSKKMNDGSIHLEMRQNVCSKFTHSFLCVGLF